MAGYGEGPYGEGPYGIGDSFEAFVLDELLREFPHVLPRDRRSDLQQYVARHEDEKLSGESNLDFIDRKIDDSSTTELDRIGALFGEYGRRADRNDAQYKDYLHIVVQSYRSTGGYGDGGFGEGLCAVGTKSTPVAVVEPTESTFSRYVSAHSEEMESIDSDIEYLISSRQIDNATADDLEAIGSLFGPIGERRGRSDSEYRAYLKSVVNSFKGRGTVPGIQFAIAGALGLNTYDITVIEHFRELENSLHINTWNRHRVDTVVDMFDIAKPSVVQLRTPIRYSVSSDDYELEGEASATNVVDESRGLGSGTIGDNFVGYYKDDSDATFDSSNYDMATYRQ